MSVSSGVPIAGGDITVKISDASIVKGTIVQGDTTDTTNTDLVCKAATAETTKPLGVTLEATTAADADCAIRVYGVALVKVNGSTSAIDIGDSICATTAGVGVISTTPDAAQQWAIGYALAPSAASGDYIPVLIDRHLIVKGTA